MPAPPSASNSIAAIRKVIAEVPSKKAASDYRLYGDILALFQRADEIVNDRVLLEEVLHLATEVEAFRGRGSQAAAKTFSMSLVYLTYKLKERLPPSKVSPDLDLFPTASERPPDSDVLASLEIIATHAFARVQGPKVRSRHAAGLRANAWSQLGLISEIIRQPAHLDHALQVAADKGASNDERQGALGFLSEYWSGEDPDEATATLLRQLESETPDRDFLVMVLQTQIKLGLNDGMGAMFGVDDWDDADKGEE